MLSSVKLTRTSKKEFEIFCLIDRDLGEYYANLNCDYFNNEGKGKFLRFCIDEELNEDDIEDEFNDYENCGYLDFDQHFPFDQEEENNLNEEEKKLKIFQILKRFYFENNISNKKKSISALIENDDDLIDDINNDDIEASKLFDIDLENICCEIKCILFDKINENIANIIIDEFKTVIYEEEYDNIDDIKEDLLDIGGSCIVDKMSQNNEILLKYKQEICKYIKQSIDGKIDINITNFIWDIRFDSELIENTIKLLSTECSSIFRHLDGPQNNAEINGSSEDVTLCIAKSIDIKNGYPILLWLIETFNRYRIEKHKINLCNNIAFENDQVAVAYNAAKWFDSDNKFTAYLSQIHPEISLILKCAMCSLQKRTLPMFNLNTNRNMFPIICDSMNIFAKYCLTFHRFCHQLQLLSFRNYPFLPLQFDVWIIPQCVYKESYENIIYHKFGKQCSKTDVKNAFWEINKYLDSDGYIKNKDYWIADIQSAELRPSSLQDLWDKKARGSQKRYQRYIFIIDRRNPINLKHREINKIPYDIYKDKSINNTWSDRIILIKPKYHNKISLKYEIIPEQLLGLSSEYLLPNPESKEPDIINILDSMNGYKFCFSFHILSRNNAKCYMYHGSGAIKFKLNDIHWLWPRYFVQNKKLENQKLENQVRNQINSFIERNKYFKDSQFQQFEKQTYINYDL